MFPSAMVIVSQKGVLENALPGVPEPISGAQFDRGLGNCRPRLTCLSSPSVLLGVESVTDEAQGGLPVLDSSQ